MAALQLQIVQKGVPIPSQTNQSSESRESDYFDENEQANFERKLRTNHFKLDVYTDYLSMDSSQNKTDIINIIKHNKWTIWSILCYPCNRVNKYIENLVNDHVVEEEIASFEYSSGDSEVDDLKKIQLSSGFN